MTQVKMVYKIEQRFLAEERNFGKVVSSYGLASHLTDLIGFNASESLLVLCLNTKNEVIAYSELFKGSLDRSISHPREIFLFAILNNSSRIVLAHVHPSGTPKPSRNDDAFTKRVIEAGELLGIPLLDHVIVTNDIGKYYSYREETPQLF